MSNHSESDVSHLSGVKHVILVLSGKGGVGKSTVAVQLALGLLKAGKKVGLLDVDLCGPSIPKMLNLDGKDVHNCPEGWVPVYFDKEQRLAVMSIAFLLENKNDAIVWRGPRKTAMIHQFINDVCWQDTEYLIIDTPPGTSDEHLAVVESLRSYNPDGAVLVTTPQSVSVGDVRREATFCQKTGIPILGLIENMSGFVCPSCKECSNLFSKGGGESLAKELSIPFWGCIPIDQHVTSYTESIPETTDSPLFDALSSIVEKVIEVENTS
ncbi:cytosolic Fe-S cluster assembly factor NUBP2 homolog [Octopus vulgaris]|uniref:Cytosolic Fe-S cluster assembly factor NUBP2 homolog n=3 Tax=Octopus TaxID=6643 RepID=A0AA36AW45_OCTVU|nr:cytosolic Fe-S cluster assembly factor NUBP2 homolog [Octopus sinensis]CAI9722804.1 cytosolic Fe-S cluster assembly factor NUBP2 homolog [Octopus vulgaris]